MKLAATVAALPVGTGEETAAVGLVAEELVISGVVVLSEGTPVPVGFTIVALCGTQPVGLKGVMVLL